MLSILLPKEITVTLRPELNQEDGTLVWHYKLDNLPLLDWLRHQVITFLGSIDLEDLQITPDKAIFKIPEMPFYRLDGIETCEFTITLKKE